MTRQQMSSPDTTNATNVTLKTIGDKQYIVTSVYVGDKDVKSALLKLAERKAIREMGLDSPVVYQQQIIA